jgi:hypothetical protein
MNTDTTIIADKTNPTNDLVSILSPHLRRGYGDLVAIAASEGVPIETLRHAVITMAPSIEWIDGQEAFHTLDRNASISLAIRKIAGFTDTLTLREVKTAIEESDATRRVCPPSMAIVRSLVRTMGGFVTAADTVILYPGIEDWIEVGNDEARITSHLSSMPGQWTTVSRLARAMGELRSTMYDRLDACVLAVRHGKGWRLLGATSRTKDLRIDTRKFLGYVPGQSLGQGAVMIRLTSDSVMSNSFNLPSWVRTTLAGEYAFRDWPHAVVIDPANRKTKGIGILVRSFAPDFIDGDILVAAFDRARKELNISVVSESEAAMAADVLLGLRSDNGESTRKVLDTARPFGRRVLPILSPAPKLVA